MTKIFITFRYIARILVSLLAACLLSSCLGGSIAQQIVSSIATKVADRAVANAMDVQDGPSNHKPTNDNNSYANNTLTNKTSYYNAGNSNNKGLAKSTALTDMARNTSPDPYQVTFVNAAFEPVKATSEPLSDSRPEQAEEVETRIAITEGNQLVRVELFNLLIGEEKNAVYEKARLLGATTLPKQREWQRWAVGTGISQSDKKIITFLIPPEFGKLPSGSIAMVELASPGELNVARYKGN